MSAPSAALVAPRAAVTPSPSRDDVTASPEAPDGGAGSDAAPFDGRIVCGPDGSLLVVDADVPWSSPSEDGEASSDGAAPSPIRSVLFVRREGRPRADRGVAGARPETKVPDGLVVDRYSVCGAGDGSGVACEATACDSDALGLSPDGRAGTRGRPGLLCCVCRLSFGSAASFAAHAENRHDVPPTGRELQLLAAPGAAAVLTTAGGGRRPAMSLLRLDPGRSDRAAAASPTPAGDGSLLAEASGQGEAPTRQSNVPSAGAAVGSAEAVSPPPGSPLLTCPEETSAPRQVTSVPASSAMTEGASDVAHPCPVAPSAASAAVASATPPSATKTLKCPRCNWHFKYRETLEMHVREKHQEGGGACSFCLSGRPHPKLARGETHGCGYKPYRCDACRYATTTKGNLSIHMQSDKHLNNVRERRRAAAGVRARWLAQPPRDRGQPAAGSDPGCRVNGLAEVAGGEWKGSPGGPDLADTVLRRLPSGGQQVAAGHVKVIANGPQSHGDRSTAPDPSEASSMRHRMAHDGGFDSHAVHSESPVDLDPQHVFTCCTCCSFSTDSLDELERHLNRDRTRYRVGDFVTTDRGSHVCHLCRYSTHLKANFQLHCQTDKHLQRLQHVNHVLEGGEANAWKLRLPSAAGPTLARCNLCEFTVTGVTPLRAHAAQNGHDVCRVLFEHLRRAERGLAPERRSYGCALCRFAARQKLPLLRHIGGPRHLEMERLRQLRRQAERRRGPDDVGAIFPVAEVEEAAGGRSPSADEPDSEAASGLSDGRPADRSAFPPSGLLSHSRADREGTPERNEDEPRAQRDGQSAQPAPHLPSDAKAAVVDRDAANTKNDSSAFRCTVCSETYDSLNSLCVHQFAHGSLSRRQLCGGNGYPVSTVDCERASGDADRIRKCMAEPRPSSEQKLDNDFESRDESGRCTSVLAHRGNCYDAEKMHCVSVGGAKRTEDCALLVICSEAEERIVKNIAQSSNSVPVALSNKVIGSDVCAGPLSRNGNDAPRSESKDELKTEKCEPQEHVAHVAELQNAEQCQTEAENGVDHVGRPYQCSACQVSYSHPQILSIHLQSASHRTRTSNCLQSSTSRPSPESPVTASGLAAVSGESADRPAAGGRPAAAARRDTADRREAGAAALTSEPAERRPEEPGRAAGDDRAAQQAPPNGGERLQSRPEVACGRGDAPASGCEPVPLRRRLLESYGLEIVMHHCESRRKRIKLDDKDRLDGDEEKADDTQKPPASRDEISNKCDVCQKEFSSLWILKFHMEHIHNRCMPNSLLDVGAGKISEELWRKFSLPAPSVPRSSLSPSSEPPKGNSNIPLHAAHTSKGISETNTPESFPGRDGPAVAKTDACAGDAENGSDPSAAEPPAAVPHLKTALGLLQAAHIRYQLQQLAALGSPLGALGLAAADAAAQPPLLPLMAAQHLLQPGVLLAAQAQALARQQAQTQALSPPAAARQPAANAPAKRARTRISGDQLKVLRAHFDLHHSPSEEQIESLARCCGLQPKVVKHWFRNTLFKERQRNKDSPYNFSVPPTTALDAEHAPAKSADRAGGESSTLLTAASRNYAAENGAGSKDKSATKKRKSAVSGASESQSTSGLLSWASSLTGASAPRSVNENAPFAPAGLATAHGSMASNLPSFPTALSPNISWCPPPSAVFGELSVSLSRGSHSQPPYSAASCSPIREGPLWAQISPPVSSGSKNAGKRANRTRFTDQQVKVLQDFFEKNAYPKEEDLARLSSLLGLGPRVIVVWFQNARQKVRKVYENQPPAERADENASRFQRTASLNYQCSKCLTVYQRYHELIRHQRQHCYSDDGSKRQPKRQDGAVPAASALPGSPAAHEPVPPRQGGLFKCGKCPQRFDHFDRWREHQVLHVMNPSPVPSSLQNQGSGGAAGQPSARPLCSASEASEDDDADGRLEWEGAASDKRLRTSINPEQLDLLHRRYSADPNPSRDALEAIARDCGLKKRVVQVWFQNTRARERKGQAGWQRPVPEVCGAPLPAAPNTKAADSALLPQAAATRAEPRPPEPLAAHLPLLAAVHGVPAASAAALHALALPARRSPPSPLADAPLDLSRPPPPLPPAGAGPATGLVGRVPVVVADAPGPSGAWPAAGPPAPPAPARQRPPSASSKRFRTQMTPAQVAVLRSVFAAHKMPTMAECARLGADIGLAKRVVQVWFQNSRAKEKKRQQQRALPPSPPPAGCAPCQLSFGPKLGAHEHVLSVAHIEAVQRDVQLGRPAAARPEPAPAPAAAGQTATATATATPASDGETNAPTRAGGAPPATPPPPQTTTQLATTQRTTRPTLAESAGNEVLTSMRQHGAGSPSQDPQTAGVPYVHRLPPAAASRPADGASDSAPVDIDGSTRDPLVTALTAGAATVPAGRPGTPSRV